MPCEERPVRDGNSRAAILGAATNDLPGARKILRRRAKREGHGWRRGHISRRAKMKRIVRRAFWCAFSTGTLSLMVTLRLHAWGELGHRLTAQAAVATLPPSMPAFFRNAGRQLVYLNPEPDRWRELTEHDLDPALDMAASQ